MTRLALGLLVGVALVVAVMELALVTSRKGREAVELFLSAQ